MTRAKAIRAARAVSRALQALPNNAEVIRLEVKLAGCVLIPKGIERCARKSGQEIREEPFEGGVFRSVKIGDVEVLQVDDAAEEERR